jgi:hypothetical protein
MRKEILGPCRIKLFDKSGKMIETEGSFGIVDGNPSLHIPNQDSIPPDFEPCRVEVEPITAS